MDKYGRQNIERAMAHYRRYAAEILTTPASEWAIEPHAWEYEAGIYLTPIERAMWESIRFVGVVLYPQVPVGRFFVDFANPVAKVAIECDGAAWHTDFVADSKRQAELEARGWTVYRISGHGCLQGDAIDHDKDGCEIYVESNATKLLRDICKKHGIKVGAGR